MANMGTLSVTLLSLFAFLSSFVHAQQYAGDVIPNSLPSQPGSELVHFRITDPKGKNNNLTLTNYQSLQTNGQRIVPSRIQRAVIVIHGLNRDPATYMSNMLSAISSVTTDSNVNQNSVVLMSPYFPNGNDKNTGYPWTTGLSPGAGSTSNALVWEGAQWASGANNQYPYKNKTVSSFEVLDQLIKWFDNRDMFPNVKQIVIAGHSLGAQMVQRYAEVGTVFATTSPVTYYIGNPNSYGWLSADRPLSYADCPTYDNWRDGLTNYTTYPMTYNAAFVTSGRANVLAQYNGRSKAYARATKDFGDTSSSCAPATTGGNRNERFFNFIAAFPATCPAPATGQCDTIDYVNTGHDAGAMFASDAGQARLFLDNFYGDGSKAYDFGYPRIQAGDDPYPNPEFNGSLVAGPSGTFAGNMTYAGCWSSNSKSGRSLSFQLYANDSNTIDLCTAACTQAGYSIAGIEFGTQCSCDNVLSYGALRTINAGCNMACPGNSSQICGDGNRLSLFANGTPAQRPIPGTPDVVGNYDEFQCMTEATTGRALSAKTYTDDKNMTLDTCAAFCNGYKYFGTQYSSQCFCGSYFNSGSVKAPDSDCSMVCAGDFTEYCGGPNRLNVYQLSSDNTASTIVQPPPSTTTSNAGGAGTASSIPTGSLCPATNGQTLTNVNGAKYEISCSSDSSGSSYMNAGASSSYLDCMAVCDAASGTGCIGWTYVGIAGGAGSGTCYLKSGSMGSIVAGNAQLISGTLVSRATNGTINSCPAANGTTINGYLVRCSSDTSHASYGQGTAAKSFLDCMTACDLESDNGCKAAVYVGVADGAGSGTCYYKTAGGTFVAAGTTLVAMVRTVVSSVSITSSTTTSVRSSTTTTTTTTTTTSRTTSTTTSTRSTTTSTRSTTSGVARPTALICPDMNSTLYTGPSGQQFMIECGLEHAGTLIDTTTVSSFIACVNSCDSSADCTDVSYIGLSCQRKKTVGTVSSNPSVFGARRIAAANSPSSSSSSTNLVTIPSATSTVVTSRSVTSTTPLPPVTTTIRITTPSTSPTTSHVLTTTPISSVLTTTPVSSVPTTTPVSVPTTNKPSTTTTPKTTSSTSALPERYTALGCYTDNTKARSLGIKLSSLNSNTPGACAVRCTSQKYRYSGTGNGKDCYCDNYIRNNAAIAASNTCSSNCAGDKSQKCGAASRLTVLLDRDWKQTVFARQSFNTWTLMSCYADSSSPRTLSTKYTVKGNMAIPSCLAACQTAGRAYCGAGAGGTCWGSATLPKSSLAIDGDPIAAGCGTVCKGNSTEACGGSSRVLVYVNKAKVQSKPKTTTPAKGVKNQTSTTKKRTTTTTKKRTTTTTKKRTTTSAKRTTARKKR